MGSHFNKAEMDGALSVLPKYGDVKSPPAGGTPSRREQDQPPNSARGGVIRTPKRSDGDDGGGDRDDDDDDEGFHQCPLSPLSLALPLSLYSYPTIAPIQNKKSACISQ